MSQATRLVHHICPYLCCHIEHALGECPLETCEQDRCDGDRCWWWDKKADVPAGVDHFAPRWVELHRDGSVPAP